jgi:hypothetical protein
MNGMFLQFGSVAFMRRHGIKYEIGLFRLNPLGQQLADISDLGYAGHGDAQFKGLSEKMIQMAIGMAEYGLITPPAMGGIQLKLCLACHCHRDGIAGYHRGCRVFIDD